MQVFTLLADPDAVRLEAFVSEESLIVLRVRVVQKQPKWELLDLRFQQYCLYMTFRHTLADPGISANTRAMSQARLTQLGSDKSAYAGMIRYFETILLEDLPWDFNIQIRRF